VSNTRKKIEKYFGKGELSRDGINLALFCPACKEKKKTSQTKRKLIVRLDDGRYQCWVCGIAGTAFRSMFRKLAPQGAHEFGDIKPTDVIEQKEEKIELPRNHCLIANNPYADPDVRAVYNYLITRGLSRQDMFRWRACAVKYGKYRRRVIIPSFNVEGELNYFVGRAIDEGAKIRYLNSFTPKSKVIFNEIDIDWQKPVVLVEGVFDAMKCPENTIPLLGSTLSRESALFQKLRQYRPKITVAMDSDLKLKAHKVCQSLFEAGIDVSYVFPPDDLDLGDMNKQQAFEIISSAVVWNPVSKIKHKISTIRSGIVL